MTIASTVAGESDAQADRAADRAETPRAYLWAADPDGNFTYTSPSTVSFLGQTPGNFVHSPDQEASGWPDIVHPDDYDLTAERWQHCLRTGEPCDNEHRLRLVDGSYRWHRTSVRPSRDDSGRIVEWQGLTIDIDEQKQAEAALQVRERELSQLVDMVPSHVWRLTPDGEPTFFNRRMSDFLGLDVADTVRPGMSRLDAMIQSGIHPQDTAVFGDALRRCLVSGDTFAVRYRLRRHDGVYHWMSSRAAPMRDDEGRILHWYGICHDIDDQMRAEEALRESQQQLQEMIDAVPVRIWSSSSTGGPLYFNRRYQDHLASVIPDFETLKDPNIEVLVRELVHPEDAPGVQGAMGRCFETGSPAVMRFRWREKGDAYRWAECRVEPWRDQNGVVTQWYGVSIDVDDEVRAQEGLRRASDRLAQAMQAASLAELSASIAHEVNQPLAAIVANSHACDRWLAAEPPNLQRAKTTVARITRDANAAAEVVSRIRALFHQAPNARSLEDVNRLIAEVCRLMTDDAAAKGVKIETELDASLSPVALDRVQVQQVLVNLIRNGMEAMEAVVSRPRTITIRSGWDGRSAIWIEVRDSGAGFKETERVFEPFFTTKENGMGMGLAICRSIVESHGGRLWTGENETHGAVVTLTLPLAPSVAPEMAG